MNKRYWFCIALVCTATACTKQQKKAEKKEQSMPNIVFILADDLGYGDLGCYGQKYINTPNIDRMAAEGMRFTQFYAGSPVCAPSRSTLVTGMHTGHTYIRGNKEIQPEGQAPIADSVLTFVEELKRAGYITGAFGKWGMGFIKTEGDPLNQGFDTFYGYNCQRQAHRYYPTHLWDNNRKMILEGNELLATTIYAPDLIQEKALDFIERNKHKPFFLFLPYNLPHAELIVPEDSIFNQYKDQFKETPYQGNNYGPKASVGGYTSQEHPKATYAAMVSRLDFYVGQVLAQLRKSGLEKNTVVIFSSDNGPSDEGGATPKFFNSNGGLRGYKRDVYEGGIRVPMIAKWPKRISAGSESDHVCAMWDFFPTFVQLAGASTTTKIDGVSILPTLLNQKNQKDHGFLYWEFHEQGGKQAVRKGKWKAVRLEAKKKPLRELALYNLEKDASETHNVAAEHMEIVKEMKEIMRMSHEESVLFPFIEKKAYKNE